MNTRRPAAPRTLHRPSRKRAADTQKIAPGVYAARLLRACPVGLLVSVGVSVALALVGAAILSGVGNPDAVLPALGVAILLLGATLGGSAVGWLTGGRALLGGVALGVVLLTVMALVAGLLTSEAHTFAGASSWLLRTAVMLFCVIGAYLATHLPHRR
jgi:putative membrane protein (TIGR04086 family)